MADLGIVVASTHGHSRRIAERLAERARAADRTVELVDVTGNPGRRLPDAGRIVVVGAVYSNQHHDDLVRWLRLNAETLAEHDTVLVSVSLAAAFGDDEGETMAWDYVGELSEVTRWEPDEAHVIGGALAESRYDPATRALLKVAAWRRGLAVSGDVDLTDWDRVDELASRW